MNHLTQRTCDGALEVLVRSAVAAGAPAPVAEEARSVTASRFSTLWERQRVDRARIEAYFWGVVRTRALRGQAPAIARLMVAASLASELREAGHPPEVVARALI
jgi:hypothetical protein